MANMEEWDGQKDWGPKYVSWWEVCEVCRGLYNWFDVEVMEGVRMYGWLHLVGYCREDTEYDWINQGEGEDPRVDKDLTWVDLRADNEEWRRAHGGKDPGGS